MTAQILHGNNLDILPTLADCSMDSIVTDPPYELGFMGKQWDATGIAYNVELWRECLRVLKPGGHLLAFGGTRTYHRMVVAIEDAGFEIRDSIHWVYGSGFPKSLDVSKAIDKRRYDRDDIYKVTAWIRSVRDAAGIGNRDIDEAFGFAGMAGHWTSQKSQPAVPTLEQIPTLLDVLDVNADDVPEEIRHLIWDLNGKKGQPGENWAKREVIGKSDSTVLEVAPGEGRDRPQITLDITAPATEQAKQWDGWGTALKPAHEPIVLARKPLIGTVANNVLAHGTGALNIDACRIWTEDDRCRQPGTKTGNTWDLSSRTDPSVSHSSGRWPANVIHDGSDEVVERFPNSKGGAYPTQRSPAVNTAFGEGQPTPGGPRQMGDDGSAARFFAATPYTDLDGNSFIYCPKPGRKERNAGLDGLPVVKTGAMAGNLVPGQRLAGNGTPIETPERQNFHPTVKPLALMRYLIRLVTPPGGTVLEPFAGSGTTLAAATLEGFDSIGIELTADYLPIIKARIAWAEQQTENEAPTLFST